MLYITNKNIIKKKNEVKDVIFDYYNNQKFNIKVNKYLVINNIVSNFYKTDVIVRQSKNLIKTGNERKEMKKIENYNWKKGKNK